MPPCLGCPGSAPRSPPPLCTPLLKWHTDQREFLVEIPVWIVVTIAYSSDNSSSLMYSDVVETVTFETETWLKFRDETETRDFKICAFCRIFPKKCRHHSDHGRPRGGKQAFLPLRLKLNTKILEIIWSQELSSDQLIKFLQCHCIFRYDTQTAQEPSSLFWCHAVGSLQFTRVHSFAWPNFASGFFLVLVFIA